MSRTRLIRLDSLEQFAAVQILSDGGAIGGPVVIPSCAQIVIQWSLESGKTAHNVLYGRFAGSFAGTTAQANAIMTAISSGAQWTALAALLHPSTSLSAVTIRSVNTANQPLIVSSLSAVPGTATGSALPSEVAAALTITTANAGKSGRGRMYIPGFNNTTLAGGNGMSTALQTALTNWGPTVRAAINANGYTHVLGLKQRAAYTGVTGTQHPARSATSVDTVSIVLRDNHWDSQRRRGLR
jgi:hypothetical protein